MEKNFFEFNINHNVFVKLTKEGIAIWKKKFEEYGISDDFPFEKKMELYTDENGLTHFQMHEFMDVFGEEFSVGMPHQIMEKNMMYFSLEDFSLKTM